MLARTKTIEDNGTKFIIALRVGCGMGKVTKSPKYKIGGSAKIFEGTKAEASDIFDGQK